jgi:DNA-binding MarR family transcriptional regulator
MIRSRTVSIPKMKKISDPHSSLKPIEIKILNYFKNGDSYSNKRLSEVSRIDTAHICRHLAFLVSNGWLKKTPCDQCCQTVIYRRLK